MKKQQKTMVIDGVTYQLVPMYEEAPEKPRLKLSKKKADQLRKTYNELCMPYEFEEKIGSFTFQVSIGKGYCSDPHVEIKEWIDLDYEIFSVDDFDLEDILITESSIFKKYQAKVETFEKYLRENQESLPADLEQIWYEL